MKDKDGLTLFKIIIRVVPMAIMAGPLYFIINNLVGIIHGASHGFNTFVTANFFESVQNAVTLNSCAKTVILMAVGLGLTAIGVQVLNGVHNFMSGNFFKMMERHMTSLINKKSARIDPIVFENTDMLDHINKAGVGMGAAGSLVFTVVTLFTFYLPYFLFMGVYLYSIKPILALSLVLIFIPVFISQLVRGMVFAKLEDKVAPIRREFDYYENAICSRELFKETRLLGGYHFFKNLFSDSITALSKAIWGAERKTGLLELLMKFCTLLGYAGVLALLVDTLLKGEISVGAFAAVFSSVSLMYGIMEEIIVMHIGYLTKNLGTIRNFISFLDLPERKTVPTKSNPDKSNTDNKFAKEVVFTNVSFSYPLATKPTINNVTVTLKAGETIAIVGENGAGKSTLVKLLMGIYSPSSGAVTIGGLDTATTPAEELYDGISAVFQNYQKYKMTLNQNVVISDVDTKNTPINAMYQADVDPNSTTYPEGDNTMLSKEFNGVDISGGQWQRVAIARGLYRTHNLVVLDEPTAAIDPIEETKIYHKFAEISKCKTAIIVTHRLGSVKIADRVIVMSEGVISQIGTHDELLDQDGIYANMWKEQAKFYV